MAQTEMALSAAKKELRKKIQGILSKVSQESITTQTRAALSSLFSLPEYQNAKTLSVYLSMPTGEISTSEIVKDAFSTGKKIFIPHTYKLREPQVPVDSGPNSIMDMVQLESMQDFQTLQPDRWGIPSPSQESINERKNCFGGDGETQGKATQDINDSEDPLDIIIMPGLAFDQHLGRLGHGKGYYDYFLQRYFWHTQKTHVRMPFLVALALNEQILPSDQQIPCDSTDYRLDAVVLSNGQIIRGTYPHH